MKRSAGDEEPNQSGLGLGLDPLLFLQPFLTRLQGALLLLQPRRPIDWPAGVLQRGSRVKATGSAQQRDEFIHCPSIKACSPDAGWMLSRAVSPETRG